VLVTRKQLECLMHVRMSKASELFGLSITALRSACRRLGIKKWSAKNLRGGLAEHAAAIADVGVEEQEALDAHNDFEETAELAHAANHAPGTQFVPHRPGVPLPQHPPAYPRPLDPSFHAHGWHSAPHSETRREPPHGFPPVARPHAAPAPPEWSVEMAQSAPHFAYPPHVGHAAPMLYAAPAAPAANPLAAPPPASAPAANAQGHPPAGACAYLGRPEPLPLPTSAMPSDSVYGGELSRHTRAPAAPPAPAPAQPSPSARPRRAARAARCPA
jgi:hypothetical protein